MGMLTKKLLYTKGFFDFALYMELLEYIFYYLEL
ncbi:hypothetical protein APH_0672 [Anaplasma phagocytophilum str. HZ]|uniref:Uncharacterized protein n=1 Tax=Anaplasma phagocytophilum (strain HZ) TaxID=212042 RepID=Q2GK47_ANAPZ|nr:hypothetical protein APH_0672 [Anaplasma phagocytophilum str. HZ]AGR80672.1 hypothetical protein WSQ_03180 [Anaplasma phagocytophilum str. JM]